MTKQSADPPICFHDKNAPRPIVYSASRLTCFPWCNTASLPSVPPSNNPPCSMSSDFSSMELESPRNRLMPPSISPLPPSPSVCVCGGGYIKSQASDLLLKMPVSQCTLQCTSLIAKARLWCVVAGVYMTSRKRKDAARVAAILRLRGKREGGKGGISNARAREDEKVVILCTRRTLRRSVAGVGRLFARNTHRLQHKAPALEISSTKSI